MYIKIDLKYTIIHYLLIIWRSFYFGYEFLLSFQFLFRHWRNYLSFFSYFIEHNHMVITYICFVMSTQHEFSTCVTSALLYSAHFAQVKFTFQEERKNIHTHKKKQTIFDYIL